MIVDQFSVFLDGGAGVAARRLHHALVDCGVASRFWYSQPSASAAEKSNYRRMPWPISVGGIGKSLVAKMHEFARRFDLRAEKLYYLKGRRKRTDFFSSPRYHMATPFPRDSFQGEILHLHWISRRVDWPSLFGSIPSGLPVVWTMHDMNPITGGCHHADDCRQFTSECRHCPILSRPGLRDLAQRNFQMKRRLLANLNLHVILPSRWLENLARQSPLLSQARSIQTIHNGLDVAQFSPQDKSAARARLGLPADAFVLAYGAESLENGRKGIAEFLGALSRLPRELKALGLLFGNGSVPAAVNHIPLHNLGFLADPNRQALAYSAADVFVMPSHAENMPQTVVESLACGTPVVAFEVGGIPEIVRPFETGFLAPLMDVGELAAHILWLAERPSLRQQMGIAGRRLVEREFDHHRQVETHIALYDRLLDRRTIGNYAA